jgi:hypothetical protein
VAVVPPSDEDSFWADGVWYPTVCGYSLASGLSFCFRWN